MFKNLWEKKIVRFLCVGVSNTLIDLIILNVLVFALHIPTLFANIVSATISICISYFLNHHIVFRSTQKHNFKRFQKFFLVTGSSILIVQTLVIWVAMHLLKNDGHIIDSILGFVHVKGFGVGFINLNIAKVLAVLFGMIWNYTLYHYVVFLKDEDEADEYDKAIIT